MASRNYILKRLGVADRRADIIALQLGVGVRDS